MATSRSGSPNDGRPADLAIFTGIWTHCGESYQNYERMKLEPHGVGRERSARQPCPLDRAPSLIHLFACPALLVEGDDPVGQARQVGDDETDARGPAF